MSKYELSAEEISALALAVEQWRSPNGPSPTVILGESPNFENRNSSYPAFPKGTESAKRLLTAYGLREDLFDAAFRLNVVPEYMDPDRIMPELQSDHTVEPYWTWAYDGESRVKAVLRELGSIFPGHLFVAAFGQAARYCLLRLWSNYKENDIWQGVSLFKPDEFLPDLRERKHALRSYRVLVATHPSPNARPENPERFLSVVRANVEAWQEPCFRTDLTYALFGDAGWAFNPAIQECLIIDTATLQTKRLFIGI